MLCLCACRQSLPAEGRLKLLRRASLAPPASRELPARPARLSPLALPANPASPDPLAPPAKLDRRAQLAHLELPENLAHLELPENLAHLAHRARPENLGHLAPLGRLLEAQPALEERRPSARREPKTAWG
jgi:hypothetical protein